MTEECRIEEEKLKQAENLLDGLLGVDARKPGAAATLPAVIRVIESLEPAGGFSFPVFPPSYAGVSDNDPPVYDLSGVAYGDVEETVRGKGKITVLRRQIIRAEHCALDSPQSQANRTEIAFLEDPGLQPLVPKAQACLPRAKEISSDQSVLSLPHRIADFRVRLSDRHQEVEAAIAHFAEGDALKLLQLMPTSIVFGFWDSRGEGTQPKHARILLSRIDAFDVIPCRRHALYSGPYSAEEFAQVVLEKQSAETTEKEKMAVKRFTNAPCEMLGGVSVKGKIERLALISLTDIAKLSCRNGQHVDQQKTNAARRYIFCLAALAEAYPRSTGSHRLRSGCELVSRSPQVVDLRGGCPEYPDADKIRALYANRRMLILVAERARTILEIPLGAGQFSVSKDTLAKDFSKLQSSQPENTVPSPNPVEPKPSRTRKKKS
jgi:CRISPR-associated protein Csb1